jgi:hypothetical protein
MRHAGSLAILLLSLASCAPGIVPEPGGQRPAPTPVPADPPSRPVAQAPDWQDWAVTPGTWSYVRDSRATIARFATAGGVVNAWVRCDLAVRAIAVGRSGRTGSADGNAMMTLRTSFGPLQWPARAATGAVPGTEAARGASDPGLDWIAFSRGRFTLELPGLPPIVAPTWAEPVRVVEDCRG